MTSKAGSCALVGLLAVLSGGVPRAAAAGRCQIEKPKIFQETYPLVTDSDLRCSFFVLEATPSARIEAAESSDGMTLIGEGQRVWARAADGEDVRPGQVFTIVEKNTLPPGSKSPQGPGPIAFRRGRLRVLRIEGPRFLGQVEKTCGPIQAGNLLLPFEEKAPVLGKDLGYDAVYKGGGDVPTGRLAFFRDELVQAGIGDWILIDMGSKQGLQIGQQLTVFGKPEGSNPPRAVANVVIVDAGPATATVKVLSARDALQIGDLVQVK